MKVLVGIIFGFLTALAIAGGVYLWLEIREQHQDLLEERKELEAELSLLETELADWTGLPEDAPELAAEIDSVKDTLQALEPNLEEIFITTQELPHEPKLVLAEPHDAASWRFYPFQLTVEGEPAAVDSFMNALTENLPLIRFDRLNGEWSYKKLELEVVGSVRFPRED